jgi:hypothetical protein
VLEKLDRLLLPIGLMSSSSDQGIAMSGGL